MLRDSQKRCFALEKLDLLQQLLCKEKYAHFKGFLGAATSIVNVSANSPIAAITKLGWVAYDPIPIASHNVPRLLNVLECS